jgi:hypothetical protein
VLCRPPLPLGRVLGRRPSNATEPKALGPGSCLPLPSGPSVGPSGRLMVTTAHEEVQHLQGKFRCPSVHEVLYGGDCHDSGRQLRQLRRRRLLRYAFVRTHLRDDGTPCSQGGQRCELHGEKRPTSVPITPSGAPRLTDGPSTVGSSRDELSGQRRASSANGPRAR